MAVGSGPTVEPCSLMQIYTESSFGADMTASLGSFTSVPFQEGTASFTLNLETHDPMHAVQHQHDYREEVLGRKRCSVQFTMPLAPTGTAAGVSTAAVQSALGLLLSTCMGGEELGTGSAAAAAWSGPSTGTVTAAAGFAKGTAFGWADTAGTLHCRPIQNKAASTLTSKLDLPGTPASSDIIYSSATYYLTQDPSTSLNFVVRGLESNDEWVLLGCQLDSLTLNLPVDGTIPTIQWTWKGASWLHGDDAAGTFADISPVTYSNTSPITGHAGRFLHHDITTNALTGATVCVSAVGFEPQLAFLEVPCPSGTEGTLRWRLGRNNGPSIMGSFSTYFEDQTWHDYRANLTDIGFYYQIGVAAGKSILIEGSTCQVTDAQRVDGGGIASVQVSWKGRLDGLVTSASSDLERSPFRIHFL